MTKVNKQEAFKTMYELIKEELENIAERKISRNAIASWKKNRDAILEEFKDTYKGKPPKVSEEVMILMYAVGYKDAIMQYFEAMREERSKNANEN